MPVVDVTVEPVSVEVPVPDACTVGQWKQMLGEGCLGDKILYSSKLQCYCFERTHVLDDAEEIPTLPQRIYIKGPNSVVKMLELALNKQTGKRSSKRGREPAHDRSGNSGYGIAFESRGTTQERPKQLPETPVVTVAPTPTAPATPVRVASSTAMWPKDSNSSLSVYSAGFQGMRPYMEDRACGYLELPGFRTASFFGVFDGHGGYQVAQLVAEKIPRILAERLKEGCDAAEALKESFHSMDSTHGLRNFPPHGQHRCVRAALARGREAPLALRQLWRFPRSAVPKPCSITVVKGPQAK